MKKTLQKISTITLAFVVAFAVVAPLAPTPASAQSSAACAVYVRDLTLGSTGSDVVALQTFLEEKGVLTIPAGVSKGYFGALTRAALARYQSSVAIAPAVGYFGPITRANVNIACAAGGGTTPTTPTNPGTGLKGGDGDIQSIDKTTSGTETTLGEGKTEDVLGFDIEADDNSDLEISSIRVKITVGSDGSNRLNRYLDEVMITFDGDEVGSADVRDFSRKGAVHTATISLKDAIIGAGDEERFYVTLTAKDSINDSDLDNTLTVEVDRVRYEDASGAILTETVTGVNATVDFEDASANDDARVRASSDTRNAGLLKIDTNKVSDEFDILTFEIKVDDDSSDLVVTQVEVELKITNASGTAALDVNKFIQDLYLEVDGDEFDRFTFNDTSIAAGATETIKAIFTIDEGDLEIREGDTVDAIVFVKFGRQAGNYAEGTIIEATVKGSGISAENPEGDNFTVKGTASGKAQTVKLSAAEIDKFTWSSSAAANNSTGIITFQFTVTADDEDFSFATTSLAFTTSGSATTSAPTWAVVAGQDDVNLTDSTYTVDEGQDVTFEVSFDVTGPGSAAVSVTSVAGQSVPNDKQYSGLKSF